MSENPIILCDKCESEEENPCGQKCPYAVAMSFGDEEIHECNCCDSCYSKCVEDI